MKSFVVRIKETHAVDIEVQADSEDEARLKAASIYTEEDCEPSFLYAESDGEWNVKQVK